MAQNIANPLYPNDDYYEIGLKDYMLQMHPDLGQTRLRGYYDKSQPSVVQYAGPLIIAKRDRAVRMKLTNELGTDSTGNIFIPVDHTYMGMNLGPMGAPAGEYTENRAVIHLHGGFTPWISDGTPHQWVTPAGQVTSYKKGVSFRNVPDMVAPPGDAHAAAYPVPDGSNDSDGIATYYYPNQQSGRLMFYHDHAYGTTRLNVYTGAAAGYLLYDPVELNLIQNGVIPTLADVHANYTFGIPLIIQDKTYVTKPADGTPPLTLTDPYMVDDLGNPLQATYPTTAETDPLWFKPDPTTGLPRWGGDSSLWFTHVYIPNQNPNDDSGANPTGRWDYGPWFWPPVPVTKTIPEVSGTPESFMDTPLVNGTPYPYLDVQRRAYRFRVLNACNDRFLSLSLFYADTNRPVATRRNPATGDYNLPNLTEVAMVDAVKPINPTTRKVDPTWPTTWPTDGRDGGVPDWHAMGPNIIQIGTEGGILPQPVVIPPQPVTYNYNRRDIVVLNVANHGLMLGPAERADILVDFSQCPDNSTVILYNDCPAPIPAFDPRFDFYTGDPDHSMGPTGDGSGGSPTTLTGYGPNTRTIMQFRVLPGLVNNDWNDKDPSSAYNTKIANLQSQLAQAFHDSQDKPLIPETVYTPVLSLDPGDAYGVANNYVRIQDNFITFHPYGSGDDPAHPGQPNLVTLPLQPKAIHELFDTTYGRMNALLGYELPLTSFLNQTTIPLAYVDPPNEILANGEVQVWKITHNGVDTHAIHFHLVNVQVLNRVGWDGAIRPPDDNEVGWKETVRMNPLEDIIVAARAAIPPKLPFGSTDSVRMLDPTRDVNSTEGFTQGALWGTNNHNILYNFGQEYVWHCHLLGHEENDMMRPIEVDEPDPSGKPTPPTGVTTQAVNPRRVNVSWTDASNNEWSFRVERATVVGGVTGVYSLLTTVGPNVTAYVDNQAQPATAYSYRIGAVNKLGYRYSSTQDVTTPDPRPITTATVTPTPNADGWNNASVSVNLAATSYSEASIASITYSLDGGSQVVTNAASVDIPITAEGTHTLQFFATDATSPTPWVESTKSVTVKIDETVPSTSLSVSGLNVTLTPTDALSGIANTYYQFDGLGWQTYSAAIVDGRPHSMQYYSVDKAGNTETTKTATLTERRGQTKFVTVNAQEALGQPVVLSAYLQDRTTKVGIGGKSVSFTVNGTVVGSATTRASDGLAQFSYTIPNTFVAGNTYPCVVTFGNNDTSYQGSTGSFTLTVSSKIKTKITPIANPSNPARGTTVTLYGTLATASSGTRLSGKSLAFYVDGVFKANGTTNSLGQASYAYAVPAGATVGSHTFTIVFAGDATYDTYTANSTFTVR